jgi:hypothetical protein
MGLSYKTYFFPLETFLPWPSPIHLSMASLSNLQTLPTRIAGISPSAAYLQIVIGCNLKYSAISLVVIISGIIYPHFFIIGPSVLYKIQIYEAQHEIILIRRGFETKETPSDHPNRLENIEFIRREGAMQKKWKEFV